MGQLDAQGLLPGTPNYEKKQKADKLNELKSLEAPLLKRIDTEWDKVLNLVHSTAPKNIDLRTLPQNPAAQTDQQHRQQIYDLRIREVSTYRDLTQDPPEARDAAWKFLEAYIAEATAQRQIIQPTTRELGLAALKSGSKDPLVRLHVALLVASTETGFTPEESLDAFKTLIEVSPLLRARKYPKYPTYQSRRFAWELSSQHARGQSNALFAELLSDWTDWLVEASSQPESLSVTWSRILSSWYEWDNNKKREAYLAALRRPEIDPWLVHMMGASFHHSLGWEYRGSGFADTVSKEGWEKLDEHQKYSLQHILYAWYLQPKIADAPLQMMNVALTNQEMGTSRDWFLRSIALRFDAWDAYQQMEWSLRPRWGGSIKELTTFAKACLNSQRFDTLVPSFGLELLIRVQDQELGSSQSLFEDPSIHESLVAFAESLDQAVADAPSDLMIPANESENRAALAALFTLAGDLERARMAIMPVTHQITSRTYRRLHLNGDYLIGRTLASTPELAEPLKRIDKVMEEGAGQDSKPEDFDPVLEDLAIIRKTFAIVDDASSRSEEEEAAVWADPVQSRTAWIEWFIQHSATTIERLKKFASGEVVHLTIDKRLLGWEVEGATWKVDAPDSIEITGTPSHPRYQLRCMARFEPPYDVSVAVTESEFNSARKVSNLGVALGSTETSFQNRLTGMRQFGVYPAGRRAAIWRIREQASPPHHEIPFNYENSFLVRVKVGKGGRYAFYVNKFRIADTVDQEFIPEREVMFGTGSPVGNPGTVTLSQMRIRKLTTPMPLPPDPKNLSAVEAYARQFLAEDREDAAAYWDLGVCLARQQKFDSAHEALQQAKQLVPVFRLEEMAYWQAICHAHIGEYKLALEGFKAQQNRIGFLSSDQVEQMSRESARILATAPDDAIRNGQEALRIILALNQNTKFSNWENLWVLAAAHAELGEYEPASKRIREARVVAPDDQKGFLGKLEKLFDGRKPYRDEIQSTTTTTKPTQ